MDGGNDLRLGLGLVSIGRPWGAHGGSPLSDDAALELIVGAVGMGIAFFDTAPAYGASEALLGRALAALGAERDRLTIATKMGEHWIDAATPPRADHSYDALRRSLDVSIRRLGRIDVLQIHKATVDNLRSADVERIELVRRSVFSRQGIFQQLVWVFDSSPRHYMPSNLCFTQLDRHQSLDLGKQPLQFEVLVQIL